MIFAFVVAIVAIVMFAQVLIAIFGKKKAAPGSPEADERVRELTQENEQLTQQLTAVHDRLETLERIVTDKPSRLEAEIDALKTLSDQREKQD
ncbi:hypothetical protein [Sphingomicrobium clamense]|uniref:Phage shock protein B n=1 Tax=Sphingomicrobium clamense TaxID=2851013 RepID=A0ABS6V631_9SPHN|nr:hypothetical protein [Sphingomicrobium sp. B8]MBW0145026.1 hypothetical protein [Sphingomicrobium sp. B8]